MLCTAIVVKDIGDLEQYYRSHRVDGAWKTGDACLWWSWLKHVGAEPKKGCARKETAGGNAFG